MVLFKINKKIKILIMFLEYKCPHIDLKVYYHCNYYYFISNIYSQS